MNERLDAKIRRMGPKPRIFPPLAYGHETASGASSRFTAFSKALFETTSA